MDIYTVKEPESMYQHIEFKLLCHTTLPNYYESGKWYNAKLEFFSPTPDTNNLEFRACWVYYAPTFGNRFAVEGNVYWNNPKGSWPHFTKIFYDPRQENRDEKINTILDE